MRLQSIITLLLISTSLPAQLQWITNPSNGHQYALSPILSWTGAESLAQQLGGNLATVRSKAEADWIDKTFISAPEMWIGMNDLASEGTWVWASGEAVTYTNWCAGEPNNAGSGEDYGILFPSSHTNNCRGHWTDGTNNKPPGLGLIELAPSGSYTSYRQACPSSAGTPILTNTSLPKIGSVFQLEVRGLGSSRAGSLLIGFDDQIWQALRLPFELTAIGAPGCWLNINPVESLTVFSDSSGVAKPVIQIPNKSSLLGLTFYNQYVSIQDAPSSRALRIATTNAGKGTIGN